MAQCHFASFNSKQLNCCELNLPYSQRLRCPRFTYSATTQIFIHSLVYLFHVNISPHSHCSLYVSHSKWWRFLFLLLLLLLLVAALSQNNSTECVQLNCIVSSDQRFDRWGMQHHLTMYAYMRIGDLSYQTWRILFALTFWLSFDFGSNQPLSLSPSHLSSRRHLHFLRCRQAFCSLEITVVSLSRRSISLESLPT